MHKGPAEPRQYELPLALPERCGVYGLVLLQERGPLRALVPPPGLVGRDDVIADVAEPRRRRFKEDVAQFAQVAG